MNALVYVDIGNLEAFLWNLNLSTKHLFWMCESGYTMVFFNTSIYKERGHLLTKNTRKILNMCLTNNKFLLLHCHLGIAGGECDSSNEG